MNDKASNQNLQQDVAASLFADRRSERRWKNVRTFLWIFLLLLYAVLIFSPGKAGIGTKESKEPYVSLVRLNGVISTTGNFSARKVIPQLNKAFSDSTSKGVLLLIDSPGGSPVQATMIHDKILQLKATYKKKVIAVGEDSMASAAYLIATAADKIYANKDTLTGSIGVILSGFGFTDAIQKLGITRRVFTSGPDKDRLDPFLPLKPEDVAKIQTVLNEVHQNFIQDVVQARQGKLNGNQAEIFSGDFWTGSQALRLGLVDAIGNYWTAMDKEFNVKYYKDYSAKPSLFEALFKDTVSILKIHLLNNTTPIKEQL